MTIDEIKKWMLESSGFPVTQANAEYLERFRAVAFKAGAASRDAYIEQLELALLQVRKALCGDIHNTDDLLDLIERLQSERNQLRVQINVLREALGKCRFDSLNMNIDNFKFCQNAFATIPEQSLAEYRNKAIEECAKRAEAYAYMSQNFNALAEELRAMKEQP